MSQSKILPSEVGLTNIKFDTSLMLTRTRQFQNTCDNSNLVTSLQLVDDVKKAKVSATNNILFIQFLLTQTEHLSSELLTNFQIAHEHLILQEEHLFCNSTPGMRRTYYDDALNIYPIISNLPTIIKSFTRGKEEMTSILKHVRKFTRIPKNLRKKTSSLIDCLTLRSDVFNCNLVVLYNSILIYMNNEIYLLSLDQLTMIHNKILEIRNVLLASFFLSKSIWSNDFYSNVVDILKFMALQIKYLGNDAYTIFKDFDGIGSGLILMKEDLFDNSDPLLDIMNSIYTDKLLSKSEGNYLLNLLEGPPEEILEKTSLSKLMGHPEIDTFKGIDKLRDRTFRYNPVSHYDINILLCSLKKNFIHQYFLRHSKWPNVKLDYQINPRIRHCVFNDLWIHDQRIPNHFPPIQLLDFQYVELSKVKDFDTIESQFPILKDTALAATRSVIEDPFIYKVKDFRLRRTLLYFLLTQNPHLNVSKYMSQLNKRDPLCLEYLVIKLTQKERELKVEGRYFGQSPYEERARRCLLEHNVSKLLSLYNSSQGMTLNELQKFQKLYTLSRFPMDKDQYYTIYISIDVEAFNNNFRREVCEPVGNQFFNKLFDVPWYSNIMDTFESTLFSFSDGECEFKWTGQYGGIEGLFQKFWTWIYESVASRVAEMTSYNHFIMVNGDDLRVVLLIPKSEVEDEKEIKLLFKEIAESFEKNYSKFGFKLKINETYFSSNYLGFGKLYFYQSRFCSLTLKKVAKTHGLANLMGDYPLEYIKGVMSESLSTMSYSVNHRYIYIIGIIQVIEYLKEFNEKVKDLSKSKLLLLLFWPSNFGGLPILPYLRCLFKGDSDIETIWLSFLIFLLKNHPEIGRDLAPLWLNSLTQVVNYQGLASNPYSLPNVTPPEGLTCIKTYIRNRLEKLCENKHFLRVLQATNEIKASRFVRSLFNCNPIPAKALSVIYSTSAVGQIDEFMEKFTTSKSVGGFLSKNFVRIDSIRVLKRAKLMDLKKIEYCRNQVVKNQGMMNRLGLRLLKHEFDSCPTLFSDKIREWCYKKPLIGVTYPCIVDQLIFYDITQPLNPQIKDYLTFWRSRVPFHESINYSHGPNKIFIGNHTHLKLISPDIDIKASSPGMSRVVKLLKIFSMMRNLGPDCEAFIKKNLKDLTGIDPDLLVEICYKHTSGSITHRVPTNHWSPLVAPNDLSNKSSYIKSTTKTDFKSKMYTGDMTINYGLIRAVGNSLITYHSEFQSKGGFEKDSIHWIKISNCPTCTFEVTDTPIVWNCEVPDLTFNISNNPYVSLSDRDKQELITAINGFISTKPFEVYSRYDKNDPVLVKLCRKVMAFNLFEFNSDKLRSHFLDNDLMELEEEEMSSLLLVSSLDLVNLSDLKAIPFDFLINGLVSYVSSWALNRFPNEFGSGDLIHLVNKQSTRLPLRTISSMLIESGVWPALREYLVSQNITSVPLPLANVENIQALQIFLIKFSIHKLMFSRSDMEIFQETQVLPISKLPTEIQINKLMRESLLQQNMKFLINWLVSEDGLRFKDCVTNFKVDLIKGKMLEFSKLCYHLPLEFSNSEFCSFETTNDPSSSLLPIVLALCGLDNKQLVDSIVERLRDIDLEEPNEIYNLFLRSRVQFLVLPTHEVTSIVRSHGNPLYKDYYDKIMIPSSSSQSNQSTSMSVTNKFIQWIPLQFSLEAAQYDFGIYLRRLELIWKKFKATEFNYMYSLSKILGQVGGFSGKLFPELLTLSGLVKIKSQQTVCAINDYHGTICGSMLHLIKNITVVPFSCDFSDQSKLPPLSDLSQLLMSRHTEIDLTFYSGYLGNILNKEHLEFLKQERSGSFHLIIMNINRQILDRCSLSELYETIKNYLLPCLTSEGSLVLEVKFQFLKEQPFEFLNNLKQHFKVITMARSKVKFNNLPTFYLVLKEPFESNDRIVFSSHGLKTLQKALCKTYSPDENAGYEYPSLSILLNVIRKWIPKLGLRNQIFISDQLQSISFGIIIHLSTKSYDEFVTNFQKYLQNESDRLRTRLKGIVINSQQYSASQEVRHLMRILTETLITSEILQTNKGNLHSYLMNPSYYIQEVVNTSKTLVLTGSVLTEYRDFENTVGKTWLDNDLSLFVSKIIELIMWCMVKYHFL